MNSHFCSLPVHAKPIVSTTIDHCIFHGFNLQFRIEFSLGAFHGLPINLPTKNKCRIEWIILLLTTRWNPLPRSKLNFSPLLKNYFASKTLVMPVQQAIKQIYNMPPTNEKNAMEQSDTRTLGFLFILTGYFTCFSVFQKQNNYFQLLSTTMNHLNPFISKK